MTASSTVSRWSLSPILSSQFFFSLLRDVVSIKSGVWCYFLRVWDRPSEWVSFVLQFALASSSKKELEKKKPARQWLNPFANKCTKYVCRLYLSMRVASNGQRNMNHKSLFAVFVWSLDANLAGHYWPKKRFNKAPLVGRRRLCNWDESITYTMNISARSDLD